SKFQGVRFNHAFLATSRVWVELTKKQPIETKAVESLKEIGRRLARFPLKADSRQDRVLRTADGGVES
ncbi:MAG: hypothetical protein LBT97_01800, partial [Planctomycetota bacterium]|nr:hypothetical protein [Planctomycetota bacterium]